MDLHYKIRDSRARAVSRLAPEIKIKEYTEYGVRSPTMLYHDADRWTGEGWQKKEVKLKEEAVGKIRRQRLGIGPQAAPPISQDPSLDEARTQSCTCKRIRAERGH